MLCHGYVAEVLFCFGVAVKQLCGDLVIWLGAVFLGV